ncbi:Transcriptional regulatory protein SDS3 [Kluyveromyces marxianus]
MPVKRNVEQASLTPGTPPSASASGSTSAIASQGQGPGQGLDLSRKDKKRIQFESKVAKIKSSFTKDKDSHYRDRLTLLQTDLTTLHQGNNLEFLRKLRDLEEDRDLELVRLRLYEEYRVYRSGLEFQEDIEKTKAEHERMIKLCKEMLYESLQKTIKKLQEERLLLDVANAQSYSMDYSRGKFQKQTRSYTQNSSNNTFSAWDSSPNDVSQTESGNETGGNATDRRSLRRRAATNQNHAQNQLQNQNQTIQGTGKPQGNSDSELMQYLSDSSELQALLFGGKEKEKKMGRGHQRLSTKSAPVLQSLTQDEVTDDISLIRKLTGQPPAPFR